MKLSDLHSNVRRNLHDAELKSSTFSLYTPGYLSIQIEDLSSLKDAVEALQAATQSDKTIDDYVRELSEMVFARAKKAGIAIAELEL